MMPVARALHVLVIDDLESLRDPVRTYAPCPGIDNVDGAESEALKPCVEMGLGAPS